MTAAEDALASVQNKKQSVSFGSLFRARCPRRVLMAIEHHVLTDSACRVVAKVVHFLCNTDGYMNDSFAEESLTFADNFNQSMENVMTLPDGLKSSTFSEKQSWEAVGCLHPDWVGIQCSVHTDLYGIDGPPRIGYYFHI